MLKKLSLDEMEEAQKHPRWNHNVLRVLLNRENIERLPLKRVTEKELDARMQSVYFNPIFFYPTGIYLMENEQGHDLYFRYITPPAKP